MQRLLRGKIEFRPCRLPVCYVMTVQIELIRCMLLPLSRKQQIGLHILRTLIHERRKVYSVDTAHSHSTSRESRAGMTDKDINNYSPRIQLLSDCRGGNLLHREPKGLRDPESQQRWPGPFPIFQVECHLFEVHVRTESTIGTCKMNQVQYAI